MERLRYTLGRLNTTAVGLGLIALAIALLVVPHFIGGPARGEPAPPPPPQAAVGVQVPGADRAPAPPQAAAPQAAAAAPQAAARPAPAPQAAAAPLPPAPQPRWTDGIGNLFLNLFAISGLMSFLAVIALASLLLWRNVTLRRQSPVSGDHS